MKKILNLLFIISFLSGIASAAVFEDEAGEIQRTNGFIEADDTTPVKSRKSEPTATPAPKNQAPSNGIEKNTGITETDDPTSDKSKKRETLPESTQEESKNNAVVVERKNEKTRSKFEGFYFGSKVGGGYITGLYPGVSEYVFSGALMCQYVAAGEWFALSSEFTYFQIFENSSFLTFDEYGNQLSSIDFSSAYHYFQVPLIAKFSIPLDFPVRPFVTIGTGINCLFLVEDTYSGMKYVTNSMDFSWVQVMLGAGVDFMINGSGVINIEVRLDKMVRVIEGVGLLKITAGYYF